MTPAQSTPPTRRLTARALLLGDRIDAAGLERPDAISQIPLAFAVGAAGFVAIYRFGVAVLIGLTPLEEEDILRQLDLRVSGKRAKVDDETAILEIVAEGEDRAPPGGPIQLRDDSRACRSPITNGRSRASSSGSSRSPPTSTTGVGAVAPPRNCSSTSAGRCWPSIASSAVPAWTTRRSCSGTIPNSSGSGPASATTSSLFRVASARRARV